MRRNTLRGAGVALIVCAALAARLRAHGAGARLCPVTGRRVAHPPGFDDAGSVEEILGRPS